MGKFVPVPRDVLFWLPEYGFAPPGPVDRFSPIPEVLLYRLDVGSGKNVGVAGREVGVGSELPVVAVLRLAPERRDAGRRIPVFIVPCARDGDLPNVGEGAVIAGFDGPERYALGAVGLESRRLSFCRSFSLLFWGDGESSMIKTHPDESPLSLALSFFDSLSLLRRESTLRRMLSRLVFAVVANEADDDEEELPITLTGDTVAFARPVMLAILSLGTRV